MSVTNSHRALEGTVRAKPLEIVETRPIPADTRHAEDATVPSWETLAMTCGFRLPELARLCNVSMRTLQRHFRKHYNTTLSEWFREVRLEKARLMLASAESVKCVAFDLGYKQPSHFTRDFKERFGVPPSALRWPFSMKVQISLASRKKNA
jgi:AraC-like DNA-binding protein